MPDEAVRETGYSSPGRIETRTKTEKTLVAYCPFCPLGNPNERGVLRVEISSKKMAVREIGGKRIEIHHGLDRFDRDSWTEVRYECGLGEEGKNCSIPKVYEFAQHLADIAERADRRSQY